MVMRLYLAGDGINSRLAQDNLRRLCELHPDREHEIRTVDVTEEPDVALERGVFVTPALEIVEPRPGGMIYGNLSDREALRPFFPQAGDMRR
jgi:circadian clock protein KaiB